MGALWLAGTIALGAVGVGPVVAQPCTPLPGVELQLELSADLARLLVGDATRLTGRIRNDSSGTAHNLRFELRGSDELLQAGGVIIIGPTPAPAPSLEPGSAFDWWATRVATHVGTASIVIAVRYGAAVGCAEEPDYEDRTALSPPLQITVESSTDCWGDCDTSGTVTVDEIQTLVGVALGDSGAACEFTGANPDRGGSVDELVSAITNALRGCPLPRSCGGAEGLLCPGRSWCEFSAGDCGVGEAVGTCNEARTLCIPVRAVTTGRLEVCGCDGVTYPSDCERTEVRISKAHDSACP